MVQEEFKFLFFDIDTGHHVFVLELWRNGEDFTKNVQLKVASDIANQMIPS